MSNEIAVKQDLGLSQVAKTFAASGYFADAKDAAQAVVKIMAGQELGIPAVAAMSGIHIVKGKPVLSSTTLAGLVKRSGKYNYRVKELSPTRCEIEFFEDGEAVGVSVFTAEDAKQAGTQNMAKFARNMLYARAMSNGVKWYCPDICAGPIYTPGEIEDDDHAPEPLPATAPEPAPEPTPAAEDADFQEVQPTESVDGLQVKPTPTPQQVKALEDMAGFNAPQHLHNARAKHLGPNPDAAAIRAYVEYLQDKIIEAEDEAEGKQIEADLAVSSPEVDPDEFDPERKLVPNGN